jgi:hypothetical protein
MLVGAAKELLCSPKIFLRGVVPALEAVKLELVAFVYQAGC